MPPAVGKSPGRLPFRVLFCFSDLKSVLLLSQSVTERAPDPVVTAVPRKREVCYPLPLSVSLIRIFALFSRLGLGLGLGLVTTLFSFSRITFGF